MRMYDVKIGLQVEAGTQDEAKKRAGQVMEALAFCEPILNEVVNVKEVSSTVNSGRYTPFHYDYTTGLATEIHPDP
jgi:hypothetical protein